MTPSRNVPMGLYLLLALAASLSPGCHQKTNSDSGSSAPPAAVSGQPVTPPKAAEDRNKELLIGSWQSTDPNSPGTLAITPDGKVFAVIGDQSAQGSYRFVEADTLELTLPVPGKPPFIQKTKFQVNRDQLVTTDIPSGEVNHFRRAAAGGAVAVGTPPGTNPVIAGTVQPPPSSAVLPPQGNPDIPLHFMGKSFVELSRTQGLLDLNGSYTIEIWVRWQPLTADCHSFAGDEAWPQMNPAITVPRECGWVLRAFPAKENQRTLNFNIGVESRDDPNMKWCGIDASPAADTGDWQHIAVCKSPTEIRLYQNGKVVATRSCTGLRFLPAPTDLYLGVRKSGYLDRVFNGDIRAFRLSSAERYKADFTPPPKFLPDQGDLVLLNFSVGQGTEVPDLSGGGHNGLISGAQWAANQNASTASASIPSAEAPSSATPSPATPAVTPPPTAPAEPATLLRTLDHPAAIWQLAVLPNGHQCLTDCDDAVMRLWDLDKGKEVRQYADTQQGTWGFGVSPNGRLALTVGGDKPGNLWEVATGREIGHLNGFSGGVCVAFSADGRSSGVVVGGKEKTLRLFDLLTGRELKQYPGHTDEVRSVAYSPDGRLLVSGGLDKTVRLWDVWTGKEIRRFQGHTERVNSVAFSSTGRQVLSGAQDSVRLWDVSTGKEIQHFAEADGIDVHSVALSPDSRLALSGAGDSSVRLFDCSTGRQVARLTGPTSGVESVAFAPDGRHVLAGGRDNKVHFWELSLSGNSPLSGSSPTGPGATGVTSSAPPVSSGGVNPASEQEALDQVKALGAMIEGGGGRPVFVTVNAKALTDADLGRLEADLKAMPNLKKLVLQGQTVTDAWLPHVKELTKLEELGLIDTAVTDAGLKNLTGLTNLNLLSLYGSPVTDASIPVLAQLKGLKQVFLSKTKVTDQGAADLQKALPEALILHSGG